jgi:hypothetical protein
MAKSATINKMKLLFLLLLIGIVGATVYFFTSKISGHTKKRKKPNWKPIGITAGVVIILLGFVAFGMYKSAIQPDIQCTTIHTTTTKPPSSLKTAIDYFAQGDYDYDTGNCQQAIVDYTKAITLNPNYQQAYNNRAYTNMRMKNYKDALPDLNKAIEFNPNYAQALMNRGDIHNYYYAIDRQRAIVDYEKVIALGGNQKETSVCGHLFLAKHNGWNFGTILDFPRNILGTCD